MAELPLREADAQFQQPDIKLASRIAG